MPDQSEEQIIHECLNTIRILMATVTREDEQFTYISSTIRMGENRIKALREKQKGSNETGNLAQV